MDTQRRITSNPFSHRLSFWLACALSLSGISCVRTQATSPIAIATAMQAVRDYGREHQPARPSDGKTATAQVSPASDGLYDSGDMYQAHIASIFAQHDFAALEKEAQEVRTSKARLRGGVWKLYIFYEAVSEPPGETQATDSDWDSHLASVKKWIAAYPTSATARLALAGTYINYAWAARGDGYSDTVTEPGWNVFGQRIMLAESVLLDAARLKEKCPYWYEAMQQVALAQGWNKQQARELFDQASVFDPTYYHFYREYANFLLPKWYGDEGETQAFAEEVYKRLGDPEGSTVYFEIASLLACQCDKERDSLAGMSWPRVKQGYTDLQRLYGTSNLKMNRFAYMSFVAGDKASARATFAALGESWNPQVWHSAANFEAAKTWASGQ